jgi:hypothetical protein
MTIAVAPSSNPATRRIATIGRSMSPALARTVFLLILAGAGVAGFAPDYGTAAAHALAAADPGLTRVLRGMAIIKSAMAAGAAAAVVWRLGAPISATRVAAYALAGATMAAGPGLIWTMMNIATGALLLHAGLAATAILLWRDPAVSRRLSAIIAARRARLGRG